MKPSDIELRLSRLQQEMEQRRERPDVSALLEESYWSEVCRLRSVRAYHLLPSYVSWLADYRRPDGEGNACSAPKKY